MREWQHYLRPPAAPSLSSLNFHGVIAASAPRRTRGAALLSHRCLLSSCVVVTREQGGSHKRTTNPLLNAADT